LNAIIVDDEENARITLTLLIRDHIPQLNVIGSYASLKEARNAIAERKPDLVFLDVQMPDESGLSLWKYFPQPDFHVVFTTSYQQYALQAIRLSALDYLLKPIDIDDLFRVVQKLQDNSSIKRLDQRLSVLETNLAQPASSITQIVLPTHDSLLVIKLDDIVRCESDNNYTKFFLVNGIQHLISKPLKEYESVLPSEIFLRIHQSHLINLRFVLRYVRGKPGQVEMNDGSILPVSRERKEALVNRLTKM
jgi:two-component system LytT family response regulator